RRGRHVRLHDCLERLPVCRYPHQHDRRQDDAGRGRRLCDRRDDRADPDGGERRAGRRSAAAAGLRVPAADRAGAHQRRREGMSERETDMMHFSRRQFLKTSVLTGAGVVVRSAHAAETTVTFAGWAFEPQVVEANVKVFMGQNPDIRVNYTPLDLQLYNEKMVALFNARSQPDAFYVRDTNLGAWVEAGWLKPIDGLPKLDELNRDIFPFNREALFYKGKQYGTPYYGDIYVYMFDKKAAAKAGVTAAPVTLDQLKAAALEVKKAGIAQYPILKGYKTNVDGLSEFWSMIFASGGRMFNDTMDP